MTLNILKTINIKWLIQIMFLIFKHKPYFSRELHHFERNKINACYVKNNSRNGDPETIIPSAGYASKCCVLTRRIFRVSLCCRP